MGGLAERPFDVTDGKPNETVADSACRADPHGVSRIFCPAFAALYWAISLRTTVPLSIELDRAVSNGRRS